MKRLLAIMFAIIMFSSLSGCKKSGIEKDFISDGDFVYYYDNEQDAYAIVDFTDSGYSKEVLYFPTHYKGKSVYSIGYRETEYRVDNTIVTEYTFDVFTATACKMYFPYTITNHVGLEDNHAKWSALSRDVEFYFVGVPEKNIYNVYNNGINYFLDDAKYDDYYKCALLPFVYDGIKETYKQSENIIVANTLYMFNYDEAPNEGYFFINDYLVGEMIENTPYEPVREGYTFAGWYKEAECLNVWNFGTDAYPETATQVLLYAKWDKN